MVAPAQTPDRPRHDPAVQAVAETIGDASGLAAREALAAADENLAQRFGDGESVVELVHSRARAVDSVLSHLWRSRLGSLSEQIALVAVGGYGRGELHPASDVDILILLPDALPDGAEDRLSDFVTALWDIGLEIGHSVRTVDECIEAATGDLTIVTTLMEHRLIDGPAELVERMDDGIAPDKMWPSTEFFAEKLKEQIARHHRYDDTGYNLEPNVKGSPGGLRDIQMIGWVAKRHFGTRTPDELIQHGFLTPGQVNLLNKGLAYLWRVRFALHLLTGRHEDRLLFDHQVKLAKMLGYEDASYTLGVEQMMQRYYRTVMDLSRINEMLLQLFEEAILLDPDAEAVPLNARFKVRNGYLQTVDDNVFARDPSALLELFLLLQQNPDIKGVSAYTIGLLKRNLPLIDEEFRQSPKNHRLFLDMLRAPEGVTHELRRMNLYGVLGLYIPAFGRIVGRMQYDLFHAYTVDEHTLFVVSNLRRFSLQRFDDEFPHCSRIMQALDRPEIVYLGGLFHDIAKGRGGDHSELGAVDAKAFCLEHGLDPTDAATVAWLVQSHLILSSTAQKKDIGDPDVIGEFAKLVGTQERLDYLYLLTVADVRGTNPKLWNSWKASLFRDLYEATSRQLKREDDGPLERAQVVSESQNAARSELIARGIGDEAINAVWQIMTADYFIRHRPNEIVWHTEWLSESNMESDVGLVDVRRQANGEGVEAALYTKHEKHTFAHATAAIDELGLNIVDARIVPLNNGYSLDTFVFMETDKLTEIDEARMQKIRRSMARVLTADDDNISSVTRAAPRAVRMFSTKTVVDFNKHGQPGQTIMELHASDRPGLLSTVGEVLMKHGIDIETAKIMTIGERAEDVFYLKNEDGSVLTEEQKHTLQEALVGALDQDK
ncbi:MAG: [protein-PII] uridylyltransferase [Woeseiaceae bacterium]|nr:[protein-PII] uridylyltransferase [Woeseiaceae bacterium]